MKEKLRSIFLKKKELIHVWSISRKYCFRRQEDSLPPHSFTREKMFFLDHALISCQKVIPIYESYLQLFGLISKRTFYAQLIVSDLE